MFLKNKRLKRTAIIVCACFIVLLTIGLLFYKGVIRINTPSEANYPVRGIDISSYQGEVDWCVLSKQNIDFAFIKATEGSTHVDSNYKYNIENAIKTDLRVGSYHFFSFESSGSQQADNFIKHVAKTENMLPPVVDIEFYADYKSNPPDKENVRQNLIELLEKLEASYEVKPILYATQSAYKRYISGAFSEYDIWIRDVYFTPRLEDGREWTFWQYSDKERLDGYNGVEKYIDMNVFNGSEEEFRRYGNN
jgi:lysozyme